MAYELIKTKGMHIMKKRSLGIRLYLWNLIILSLLVGGFIYAFSWYYIQNQSEKIGVQLEDRLIHARENVQDTIAMLDTIALQLSTNPSIISIMDDIPINMENNYFNINFLEAEETYALLWSYILNPNNVSRVSVYNQYEDHICAGEVTDTGGEKFREAEFITALEDTFQEERVTSLFVNDVNKSVGIERQGISVIREIKNSYLIDNTGLGYVEVKLNLDKLEEKIMSESSDQVVIIYDLKTEQVLGTSIDGYIENTRWMYQHLIDQLDLGDAYCQEGVLPEYNLGFVVLQDKNELNTFMSYVIVLGLLLYIWLVISVAWIQKRVVTVLTEPLIRLCDTVEYAESKQDRGVAIENSNIYEIEVLSTAFSNMINRLEESMQQEVAMQTSQIKTQLYALHAQMNPHFIHNTIAIIQSYAIDNQSDIVISTCERLSDLIRYSSKLSNRKVKMIDEVNHIRNYMALVKLRYEDNIIYNITLPDELSKKEIPSFLVQPLVENSLNHGLKKKPFPWEINISCYERYGRWLIEIKDNGCGISTRSKINIMNYKEEMFRKDKYRLLESEDWEIGGLTIRNILVRLFLEYGEQMIFEVESREGLYTIIRIGGQ